MEGLGGLRVTGFKGEDGGLPCWGRWWFEGKVEGWYLGRHGICTGGGRSVVIFLIDCLFVCLFCVVGFLLIAY